MAEGDKSKAMEKALHRHVVVGRDGVLIRRLAGGKVLSWREIEFLPRALDGLRLLASQGCAVLVVSNRECAEKSLLRPHEHQQVVRRLMLEAALAGGRIDQVYDCAHAPGDGCNCRSPQAGLLRRAIAEHALVAAETYVIGDSAEDMHAAAVAGCPTIFLRRDAFLDSRTPDCDPGKTNVSSLYEAVELILKQTSSSLEIVLRRNWPRSGPRLPWGDEPAHHN
jgi:D-glycero-D-manno-heptose 1,7-bisphosphate phosphatase